MKHIAVSRRIGALVAAVAMGATVVVASGRGHHVDAFVTSLFPYVVPLTEEYEIKPLLSVGDRVPETGDSGKTFQMVGIPDGMGAHASGPHRVTLYMNHELGSQNTLAEILLGEPRSRGAYVSKLILNRDGGVISGERAYDKVYINDTYVGPAAAEDNSTPGFARFCSGALAGPEHGFDRYIYFANEENGAPNTFDGRGGLSVAIFNNEAHALPYLGRFPWENTLVQPNTGRWTVIMGMEDGPASLVPAEENSQLYMYVGYKSYAGNATVLERNGLVGGKLYVFRAKDLSKNSELPFQNGSILGEWIHIPNAQNLSQAELETASDDVNGMRFGRPEDGAFNPRNDNEYFFVTTGTSANANVLGRLYSLRLNPYDATKPSVLKVLYNADQIIAAGGDIAISPDNIDVSHDYLMINEDGTAESRAVMSSKGRDGSIWRFKLTGSLGLDVSSAERIAELDPPGRDGTPINPGVWETTGIIDTSEFFGKAPYGWGRFFGSESWLVNAQAHPPTGVPYVNTVEDGQLLLMTRTRRQHHFPWFFWFSYFR